MSTTTTDPREVIAGAVKAFTRFTPEYVSNEVIAALTASGHSIVPVASGDVGELARRLETRAKTMNGTLVGASDGHTYALGYYDQFASADDKLASSALESLAAEVAAAHEKRSDLIDRCWRLNTRAEAAEASLAAVTADRDRLVEAAKDALAALVAAHSLLSRSPKTAAPSNQMFDTMLSDYAAAITRTRAALTSTEDRTNG